jgi:flagellar hook-associated protein 3 FlgL
MRIADKMNYDQVTNNLSKNRSEMNDLQNQAATQKRLTKPSDDPVAASRVLATRTEINGNNQFLKSVTNAKTFLEYSDQSLGELSEALMRAKELAISQANDASSGPKSKEVTSAEIAQIHQQAVQIGNRKLGDRFLFGGFRTTLPPFDPEGKYYGDNGEMQITINKEASVAMNIPGSQAFLGRNLKAPANAGPVPSQNFSSPTAEGRAPASALTIGADKIAGATATDGYEAGEIHQPPVGANGLPVAGEAPAEKRATGLGSSWNAEGTNVFKVLKNLEIALKSNDKAGVQQSLDDIDDAISQVVLSRAKLGSRVGTLNSAMETLQKGTIDAKTMASNLEDADTLELVSDISKNESTLKATLATSGKLIQPSLLDFLR